MKALTLSILFFFISCNPQSVVDLKFLATGEPSILLLELDSGAYRFTDRTYAPNCLSYLNADGYADQGDGYYWIDPDGTDAGNPEIRAYCDMSRNGGGWTLVALRRGANTNREDCGANLNDFFSSTCGDSTNRDYADSYSIGDSTVRSAIVENGEWLFVDFNSGDTEDSDDAYIIHNDGSDLFFSSLNIVNKTPVIKVCDLNNLNCDETDVHFVWVGNGWWANTVCSQGFSTGIYVGNFGYCHNGITASYYANGLFGDRNGYNETKLWAYPNGFAKDYQTQIWVR